MASRKPTNSVLNPGVLYGEEDYKVKGHQLFSYKSGFELMQNCDLPPPVKVFAGPEKIILSPITREDFDGSGGMEFSGEKLELLKALRLSQTRAREAERKLCILSKERDDLSKFLLEESLQLFAYKQWLKLMEYQVSKLEKQEKKKKQECAACQRGTICWDAAKIEDEEDDQKGSKSMKWFVAFAFCLGIAGFGFACWLHI